MPATALPQQMRHPHSMMAYPYMTQYLPQQPHLPHHHHNVYDNPPPLYREEDDYNDECYDADINGDIVDTAAYRSVKRRRRLTQEETRILNEVFDGTTKPNSQMRKKLAAQLGMTPRAIQIWFQNRRAKMKRDALEAAAPSCGQNPTGPPSTKSSPSPLFSPSPLSSTRRSSLTNSNGSASDSDTASSNGGNNNVIEAGIPAAPIKESKADRAPNLRLDLSQANLYRKPSNLSSGSSRSSICSLSSYSSTSPSLSPLSSTADDVDLNSVYSATPSVESFPSPNGYMLQQIVPSPTGTAEFDMSALVINTPINEAPQQLAYPIDYQNSFAPTNSELLSHQAQQAHFATQNARQAQLHGLGLVNTGMQYPLTPLQHPYYPVDPSYAINEPNTPTDPSPCYEIPATSQPPSYFPVYRPHDVDPSEYAAVFDIGSCGVEEFGRPWAMKGECGFEYMGVRGNGEVMGCL